MTKCSCILLRKHLLTKVHTNYSLQNRFVKSYAFSVSSCRSSPAFDKRINVVLTAALGFLKRFSGNLSASSPSFTSEAVIGFSCFCSMFLIASVNPDELCCFLSSERTTVKYLLCIALIFS